eukprot:scaffold1758_cov101-Isochrysis_galbana.AAC.1
MEGMPAHVAARPRCVNASHSSHKSQARRRSAELPLLAAREKRVLFANSRDTDRGAVLPTGCRAAAGWQDEHPGRCTHFKSHSEQQDGHSIQWKHGPILSFMARTHRALASDVALGVLCPQSPDVIEPGPI